MRIQFCFRVLLKRDTTCESNVKLMDIIEQEAPDHCLVLPGQCMEHATANCIAPVGKTLGVVCPLFCLCKGMQQGDMFSDFVESLQDEIADSLDVIKARCSFSACSIQTANTLKHKHEHQEHMAHGSRATYCTYIRRKRFRAKNKSHGWYESR